jgi:predicted metal-dependent phosphoesterase TrpH
MSSALRLDLHVHSRFSPDSRLDLELIPDRLGLTSLQGFALTDHNTVEGHGRLRELQAKYRGYWFIPGVEVSTQSGHLLVYGIGEAPPARRPLPETLDWVVSHGGIAALAHPLRWTHGAGRRWARRARVQAIEGCNGRTSELGNARAELIAAERKLASVGGSDAHEAESLGRAFTEFPNPVGSLDDLLEQMRRGICRAAGTSMTVGGRIQLGFRNALLRSGRLFRPI